MACWELKTPAGKTRVSMEEKQWMQEISMLEEGKNWERTLKPQWTRLRDQDSNVYVCLLCLMKTCI